MNQPPSSGASAPVVPPQLLRKGRTGVTGHGSKLTLRTGLAIDCPAGALPCSATASAKVERKRGRVLARRRLSVAAGGTRALTLRLSKKGARALRRARRLRVTLLVSISRPGTPVEVIARTLRLRAPKRKR